jgi:hypothetical protein
VETGLDLRKFAWAVLALIAEAALQISGYKNVPLAIALGVLCVVLALYAGWPWVKRRFQPTSAERPQEQHHAEPTAPPVPSPLPASESDESETQQRTFIDVTPAYLVGLFEGHTDLQATKLTPPFIGKWISSAVSLRRTGYTSDRVRLPGS